LLVLLVSCLVLLVMVVMNCRRRRRRCRRRRLLLVLLLLMLLLRGRHLSLLRLVLLIQHRLFLRLACLHELLDLHTPPRDNICEERRWWRWTGGGILVVASVWVGAWVSGVHELDQAPSSSTRARTVNVSLGSQHI
jgi:hypothetical protein